METLSFNIAKGRPRRVVENGVEYLVCHATSIVPGVLHGSRGALFYPPAEIKRSVRNWDGMPLTLDHPYDEVGNPVHAQWDGVEERQHLGHLRNSHVTNDGKLKHECWFNVEKTKKLSSYLLGMIQQGRQIEVSTGLHTDNIPAQNGANHNGRPFDYVATNYRPDHLAVLINERGACSIQDGCGIHNRSAKFYRPENYDKVKDLEGGKQLWAGANDWESGWTWAGIHGSKSRDSDGYITDPERFIEVSHKNCPGCHGTLNAGGRESNKSCQEYGKQQVAKWAGVTINAFPPKVGLPKPPTPPQVPAPIAKGPVPPQLQGKNPNVPQYPNQPPPVPTTPPKPASAPPQAGQPQESLTIDHLVQEVVNHIHETAQENKIEVPELDLDKIRAAVQQALMNPKATMQSLQGMITENCGGQGGTPGPCKTRSEIVKERMDQKRGIKPAEKDKRGTAEKVWQGVKDKFNALRGRYGLVGAIGVLGAWVSPIPFAGPIGNTAAATIKAVVDHFTKAAPTPGTPTAPPAKAAPKQDTDRPFARPQAASRSHDIGKGPIREAPGGHRDITAPPNKDTISGYKGIKAPSANRRMIGMDELSQSLSNIITQMVENVLLGNTPQRHLETGQFLPKNGASKKQNATAARMGYGDHHRQEFEGADEELDEDDAAAMLVGKDNEEGDDGRDIADIEKEEYNPTADGSQEGDFNDHQDTDGTRNAWTDAAREASAAARKASGKANKASYLASKNTDKSSQHEKEQNAGKAHRVAANAHKKAAEIHHAEGNVVEKKQHLSMVKSHEEMVRSHALTSAYGPGGGFSKNSNDGRDVDTLKKEEHITSESQEDDFDDDQDTDGTRNDEDDDTLQGGLKEDDEGLDTTAQTGKKVKKGLVGNEWSDQAREAAILARRASLKASTDKYNRQNLAWPSHAQAADDLSKQAFAATKNDHKAAAGLHHQAAEAHTKAAEETKGSLQGLQHETAAKMHQKAALAHENAWKVKTRNSNVENCGGVGGTPGPCPTSKEIAKANSSKADEASRKAAKSRDWEDHDKAKQAHLEATKTALRPSGVKYHNQMAKIHAERAGTGESLLRTIVSTPHRIVGHLLGLNEDGSNNEVTDNCGGVGGTPGPCPSSKSAHAATTKADIASASAKLEGDKTHHTVAEKLHFQARSAHLKASKEAKASGDMASAKVHESKARYHVGKILEHRLNTLNASVENTWTDEARAAAAEARKASNHATVTSKSGNHQQAAQAHYDAATAHGYAAAHGVPGAEKRADTHEKLGDEHYRAWKGTKNSVFNVWSDAAREAAAQSRFANHTSNNVKELGKDARPVDHRMAMIEHERAMESHDHAAHQAVREGKSKEASEHRAAYKEHEAQFNNHQKQEANLKGKQGFFSRLLGNSVENAWSEEAREASAEARRRSGRTVTKSFTSGAHRSSEDAHKATLLAEKSNTPETHSTAHEQHMKAAALHQAAGDKALHSSADDARKDAANHLEAAQAHRNAAFLHRQKAGGVQNAWSEEARQAAAEARKASAHAAEKTTATSGGRGIAANPAHSSNLEGAHDTSARAHENMAFAHFQAAQTAKGEGKTDDYKSHMQAAKAHDQARAAHETAFKAGARPDTRNSDTSSVTSNSDDPFFSEGDMDVTNTWSDEARAAALEARKASSSAHAATKKGGFDEFAEHHQASHLAEKAAQEGNHKEAAKYHNMAAKGHREEAKDEFNDNRAADRRAAQLHTKAAQAHKLASSLKQGTTNSFFLEGTMTKAQRKILLTGLTANCSCDKDKAALNSLSDEGLQMIFGAAGATTNAEKCPKCGAEMEDGECPSCGYTENDGAGGKAEGSNADVTGGKGKFAQAGGEGKKEEYNKNGGTGKTANKQFQSVDEWKANSPPEVVKNYELIEQHIGMLKEQKARRLVANIANKDRQEVEFKKLMKKTPEELDWMLGLMATNQKATPTPPPIFLGQSTTNAIVGNDDSASEDVLPLPNMNSFPGEAKTG